MVRGVVVRGDGVHCGGAPGRVWGRVGGEGAVGEMGEVEEGGVGGRGLPVATTGGVRGEDWVAGRREGWRSWGWGMMGMSGKVEIAERAAAAARLLFMAEAYEGVVAAG